MEIQSINNQEFALVTIKGCRLGEVVRRYPDGRWARRHNVCPRCDTSNWQWCTKEQDKELEAVWQKRSVNIELKVNGERKSTARPAVTRPPVDLGVPAYFSEVADH